MTISDSQGCTEDARILAVSDALRTRYWSWTLLDEREAGRSLLELLIERLPHLSPQSWESRFAFGGIYVNGIQVLHDLRLPTPCKIEYYEPKFDITSAHEIFPEFKDDYVLYQDDYILVAYKPPGLSSMPAKEQRHFSLKASIEQRIRRSVHMPSRLDVSAQGLVLMSISPTTHAALQKTFETRTVTKTYACASSRPPKWNERRVTAPIARDPIHPVLRTARLGTGQVAETIFQFLGACSHEGTENFVMSAYPVTGRTHQIRVHAAHENVPLLGDRFYGGVPCPYLHLISHSINCTHPFTGRDFSCTLPLSLQPAWLQLFSDRVHSSFGTHQHT